MSAEKPNALEHLDEISLRLRGRTMAVFLDFDGTLTPIVARPELAVLDSDMRVAIVRLAQVCPVAVVSGRDLEDVRQRVGIDGIWYAGSHGFDIAGPGGVRHEHAEGLGTLPKLAAAEQSLRASLNEIEGTLVERKHFSVAAHFRLTPEESVPAVESAVDAVLAAYAGLRKGYGKKVFELMPDVGWDKGAAVRWLLDTVGIGGTDVMPLYVGDDITDEDAFRALAGRGLGIVVLTHPRPSAAGYRVRDPHDVRQFLEWLAGMLERGPLHT